jgi:hypothetical protein
MIYKQTTLIWKGFTLGRVKQIRRIGERALMPFFAVVLMACFFPLRQSRKITGKSQEKYTTQ